MRGSRIQRRWQRLLVTVVTLCSLLCAVSALAQESSSGDGESIKQVDAVSGGDGEASEEPAEASPGLPEDQNQPELGPLGPVGVADTSVVAEPVAAKTLVSWVIEGTFKDPETTVQAFVRPLLSEKSTNWNADTQDEVRALLLKMGYHVRIDSQGVGGRNVHAVLHIVPLTTVRRVRMNLDVDIVERARQPVFRTELRRRMILRPGTPLLPDANARLAQLRDDEERLLRFLREDGFYEAKVTLRVKELGDFSAEVQVNIDPGPAYFVGNVRMEGNIAIPTEELTKLFHHGRFCVLFTDACLFERRFSRLALTRDLERLKRTYQKRGYPGVSATSDYDLRQSFDRRTKTVNFTVTVQERRQVEVLFEGNEHQDVETLAPVLTLSKVGSYDDVEVDASADAIRTHYQERGYFEAQVHWEREAFPDLNFERILFHIEEGPKLRVRDVGFVGNTALSNSRLSGLVTTKVFRTIIVGESGGYATTKQLEGDRRLILEALRRLGYLDAQVAIKVNRGKKVALSAPALSAAIASDAPADGLYITYVISEGPKSIVNEVRFVYSDTKRVPESVLVKKLQLVSGVPFNPEEIDEDRRALQSYYFQKGFPRAQITSSFERRDSRVIITHVVKEYSPARVGKIIIRGNFKTHDWVIRDELHLKEGDLFTLQAAERARSSLRQTDLFSAVQVEFVEENDFRAPVVNVLVRVEERHDYWATTTRSFGYSTDSHLFAEGTIAWHNLLGTGTSLSTRGLLGQEQRYFEGKVRFPTWVMRRVTGTDLVLDVSGSYNNEETERFGDLRTIGGSVAVSRSGTGFFKGWTLSLRYDYRRRNRDVPLIRPAGNSDHLTEDKVTTTSSTIGPYLVIDKLKDRDGNRNPLVPGRGFRIDLRAVFAEDILGSDRFVTLGGAGQHYLTLGKRKGFTVSNGLRLDYGIPLGANSALLPQVERFVAGGDTTVRGYEEDRLATQIVRNELSPVGTVSQLRVLPAGGNIRFIHNLDLQLEVWELPWIGVPMTSSVFVDTGLIRNSLEGVGISDLRHSLGVAFVRAIFPFGKLSFEYAVPLSLEIGDDPSGRFHINLGLMF